MVMPSLARQRILDIRAERRRGAIAIRKKQTEIKPPRFRVKLGKIKIPKVFKVIKKVKPKKLKKIKKVKKKKVLKFKTLVGGIPSGEITIGFGE